MPCALCNKYDVLFGSNERAIRLNYGDVLSQLTQLESLFLFTFHFTKLLLFAFVSLIISLSHVLLLFRFTTMLFVRFIPVHPVPSSVLSYNVFPAI